MSKAYKTGVNVRIYRLLVHRDDDAQRTKRPAGHGIFDLTESP
jgi:hypothetical protein